MINLFFSSDLPVDCALGAKRAAGVLCRPVDPKPFSQQGAPDFKSLTFLYAL